MVRQVATQRDCFLWEPDFSCWLAKGEYSSHYNLLAVIHNETVGIMLYKITGYKDKLISNFFLYENSIGKFLLLQFIAQHADHVNEVQLRLHPNDNIENWVSDLDHKVDIPVGWWRSGMARVVDVRQLQGIIFLCK